MYKISYFFPLLLYEFRTEFHKFTRSLNSFLFPLLLYEFRTRKEDKFFSFSNPEIFACRRESNLQKLNQMFCFLHIQLFLPSPCFSKLREANGKSCVLLQKKALFLKQHFCNPRKRNLRRNSFPSSPFSSRKLEEFLSVSGNRKFFLRRLLSRFEKARFFLLKILLNHN